MKKILISSVALVALAISTAAFAQIKEFGPSFYRYTIDIPDGWTTSITDERKVYSLGVANEKQDSILFLCIVKNNKMSVKEIINSEIQEHGIVNYTIKNDDNDGYTAVGMLNGIDVLCSAYLRNGKVFIVIIGGEDKKTIKAIYDSVQKK